MKINTYEKTFSAVNHAINVTDKLNEMIDFLREHPMSRASEIREAIYPDAPDYLKNSNASHIGAMLKILRYSQIIKVDIMEDKPITFEEEKYMPIEGEPPCEIEVFDHEGNKYMIENPYYKKHSMKGEWRKALKTIVPKYKVYTLIK